jgi:proteasome lid subunit RPN8/RPN11
MNGPPAWRIWISESASEAITSSAAEHHPQEIGGVLIGVAAGGRPWVTLAVTVPSRRRTPVYYELPAGARGAAVDRARRRDGRLGYLGDWHSHPVDVGPSDKDRSTMAALAEGDADCPRPVLVIARRSGEGYLLDAHQQVGIRLRPLRLIAAGPLPPPQSDRKGAGRPTRPRSRR